MFLIIVSGNFKCLDAQNRITKSCRYFERDILIKDITEHRKINVYNGQGCYFVSYNLCV